MDTQEEVTLDAPLALQYLIESNNQLLKDYQKKLYSEVESSIVQMMNILGISPANGWKFDMERMVFVRPKTDIEQQSVASVEEE